MTRNPYREFAAALKADWRAIARPNQLPPPGDWAIWLLLAGRGFGKTRVLSEWVKEQVQYGVKRIAIVGATAADCRDVLVEGESGILACASPSNMPQYEPSKTRLTWPNGAIATTYSAEEPDRLRGPNHDAAVCDELAAWKYPEAWDMLMFTLRKGKSPRCVVATTPKPTKLVKSIVAREGQDVVITRGSTYENKANLAPQFVRQVERRYAGTRLGRQELNGELLLDTPGALWNASNLEETRVAVYPPLQRIVVAIDPSGSNDENADEAGIIVAGVDHDGEGYILADASGRMAPIEWARKAVALYHAYKADRIVAETNFGAQMVITTIATVDVSIAVKAITSSRGKVLRAEPISAIFEQHRAHLVGTFSELEDQMTSFTADYDRSRDGSPDRVDAAVFALSELLCGQPVGGYFTEQSLLVDGAPIDTPQKVDYVFAVAASNTADTVGVVYFGCSPRTKLPHHLVIVDWGIHPVDEALFDIHLPRIFDRLQGLSSECRVSMGTAGLFAQSSSGVCAAILQQCADRGFRVTDIDAKTNWSKSLDDRVHAAARHLHTARKVKITRHAHEKKSELRGVTRNHLIAQYLGFKAEEPLPSDEMLNALISGVLLSLDDSEPKPAAPPAPTPPAAPQPWRGFRVL